MLLADDWPWGLVIYASVLQRDRITEEGLRSEGGPWTMVSYAKRGEVLEELRGRSNKTWIVRWGPVRCGHVERVTGNGLLGYTCGPGRFNPRHVAPSKHLGTPTIKIKGVL
jgi:hypothetical protein